MTNTWWVWKCGETPYINHDHARSWSSCSFAFISTSWWRHWVQVSRLMASLGNCQEGDGILTDSHRFTQNSTAVTLFCTFVKQHRQAWKWKVTFLIGESWRINYKYTVAMFNDRLNCQRDPEGMTISSYTSEIGFTMCFLDRFLLW